MITYDIIKENKDIKTYIEQADASLRELGYTEHSYAHVCRVAEQAGKILELLGHSEREAELAKIAGYMHDIGNIVNREEHSQSGAVMAFRILDKLGMPPAEIAKIMTAIGNHDEGNGVPVSDISAALILADKTDVRRTRVRNSDMQSFDIHDRVNYSVTSSNLVIIPEAKEMRLVLTIDTKIGSIMDYFEIFIGRMKLCRRSAERLGSKFVLVINGQELM